MDKIIVKSVKHTTGHRLAITFSDGVTREVDFMPFLKGFRHPSLVKYLNVAEFLKYDLIDGNINWDDYNMIFPVEDLYKGEVWKETESLV